MDSNFVVTEFAEFYKSTGTEGELRYFPVGGAGQRQTAREHDAAGDPPKIAGYGLYDTNQSSQYAVNVFSSREEAVEASGGDPVIRGEGPTTYTAPKPEPEADSAAESPSTNEQPESDAEPEGEPTPSRQSRKRG